MGNAKHRLEGKIVVVEDDPTFLSFWGRMLQDLGLKDFELFSDAAEAGLLLEEVPVGLLISDVVMPSRNGYELARIASRRNPGCNIILTTAYATDLSRFELAGCRFQLLHKPYTDLAALRRFIMHIIDGDVEFDDISEDSSSENEDYPGVTEWRL
ncbi:MAG: response regulator [Pseudomonadota bacterium]